MRPDKGEGASEGSNAVHDPSQERALGACGFVELENRVDILLHHVLDCLGLMVGVGLAGSRALRI